MHQEILSIEQLALLPLVKKFSKKFYLVGGTAIALHIGHRYSIDFDLFSEKTFSTNHIIKAVEEDYVAAKVLFKGSDQIHFNINEVKLTFFEYPFGIPATEKFENEIRLPALKTLGAMKAFALGGRAKWKDYVDLYFILKHHFSMHEISDHAKELFGVGAFNEKLFRQQLSYFKDISFSEPVQFLSGFEVSELQVKDFLTEVSTEKF